MKYLANLNKNHLVSFLVLTIGSLILGTEDRSAISNHYYITDRAFTIKQGGIIHVEYGVKQNDSYLSGGLNPVTIEFDGSSTDAVNYGYLPQVANHSQKSYSAWINLNSFTVGVVGVIMGNFGDAAGCYLYARDNGGIAVEQKNTNTSPQWATSGSIISLNTWHHIVMTLDISSNSNNPTVYIDGVSYAVSYVVGPPTGVYPSETGVNFVIGNRKTATKNYDTPLGGKIFDPRVYNCILTPAEVTTLYNGGVPDHTLVTNGLVFQGLSTYADRPLSAGTVLTSTDRLVENIIRAVGVPNGSPTIRANP